MIQTLLAYLVVAATFAWLVWTRILPAPARDRLRHRIGLRPIQSNDSIGLRPIHSNDSIGLRPIQSNDSLGLRPIQSNDSLGLRPARPTACHGCSGCGGNTPVPPRHHR